VFLAFAGKFFGCRLQKGSGPDFFGVDPKKVPLFLAPQKNQKSRPRMHGKALTHGFMAGVLSRARKDALRDGARGPVDDTAGQPAA
jgi:hypothetical protein